MQTLKLLFSKITDDNPIYEKKDVVENIFVFRMLLIWHILYTFVFILKKKCQTPGTKLVEKVPDPWYYKGNCLYVYFYWTLLLLGLCHVGL